MGNQRSIALFQSKHTAGWKSSNLSLIEDLPEIFQLEGAKAQDEKSKL